MGQNFNNNNVLDTFQVPKTVYNAIRNAAAKTGVNFTYLIEKAAAESAFNPNAKAKTSSATGLFQFIDSTWMSMVKEFGDKYGLSKYVDKIDDNGRVPDSKTRREILNLRKDPEIASYMAAEFAQKNHDYLSEHVGGKIGSTELYLAHFLGAGGAAGFLKAMNKSPNMTAADIFPREARANRGVFYDSKTGAPRSLKEIYAFFDKKFDDKKTDGLNQTMLAAETNTQQNMGATSYAQSERTQNTGNYNMIESPFERLSGLLNAYPSNSLLRIVQEPASETRQNANNNLQIFPSNLYGNLSLSPAQMMLLDDFTA
jgi:hypothetical protein